MDLSLVLYCIFSVPATDTHLTLNFQSQADVTFCSMVEHDGRTDVISTAEAIYICGKRT